MMSPGDKSETRQNNAPIGFCVGFKMYWFKSVQIIRKCMRIMSGSNSGLWGFFALNINPISEPMSSIGSDGKSSWKFFAFFVVLYKLQLSAAAKRTIVWPAPRILIRQIKLLIPKWILRVRCSVFILGNSSPMNSSSTKNFFSIELISFGMIDGSLW